MSEVLAVVAVGAAGFAGTSLDNLVLIAALIRGDRRLTIPLCTGQLLASSTVVAVGLVAAEVADFAPERWVGWLGLIPVALGVRQLLLRRAGAGSPKAPFSGQLRSAGAAALLLAQSGDALAVFIPLFAETEEPWSWVLAGVVLAASGLLCVLATGLARLQIVGGTLDRVAHALVPFVLIGVGLYVLSDTATDVLR